jgi:hypothetical protein
VIALYLLILLAWSGVCVLAGLIWQETRQAQIDADDMTALDEWATRQEQRMQ